MNKLKKSRTLKCLIFTIFLISLLSQCSQVKKTERAPASIDSIDINSEMKADSSNAAKDIESITFCCTNHNPKHCGKGDELTEFKERYNCKF